MSDKHNNNELSANARYGFAYPVVDAALRAYFDYLSKEASSVSWKRKAMTSGSCLYSWSIGEHQCTALITAVLNDTTHCHIDGSRPGDARFWIESLYMSVMQYINGLMNEPLLKLDPQHPLHDRLQAHFQAILPSVPKRRRDRQDPTNREAREALARGEDRKTVFGKWARAKKYNLSDPEDSKRADDAFRQIRSRKPKDGSVT